MDETQRADHRTETRRLQRNRRGTRTLLWIVCSLYPAFGVLDYLLAPRNALYLLWGTRALVTLVAIGMFRFLRSPAFDRHADLVTSLFMLVCGAGISMMTVFMGGLASPYYAGLTLAIVATGLLFVWPRQTIVITHSGIVGTFLLFNVLFGSVGDVVVAFSNLAFLISTAVITGIGQLLYYRTFRETMQQQVRLEETKIGLENAHSELKALDRFKSQFFANITHEFKTPLAMVLAPLELILHGEMGELTAAQETQFTSMFKSGLKLLKMIGDLLDLSKLEESKLRIKIAEADLAEYLRALVAQLQPLAQRKEIALVCEIAPQSCIVWCDLERMERVFMNLLSNATKFTPMGGRIVVTLRDEGAKAIVTVQDNGPGFPNEKAERIFERFYQVDMGGTRKYGGTGIGLALAREIVELHGGTIRAESNEGATFTVELIKDREHFRPEVLDRRGAPRSLPGGARGGDRGLMDFAVQMAGRDEYRFLELAEATERRVSVRDTDENLRPHVALVVDDTPDILRLVHSSLRSYFKVLSAEDGLKGLELALRERPSLIITDLMMPGIDGLELTRRLRAEPATAHIPILMLSAKGDLNDRVQGIETGVSAYLAKPFSPRELLSQARALVAAQSNTAEMVMTQKMDSLQIVAGGLAHEINNPLNYLKNALLSIRQDAQTLLEGKPVKDVNRLTKRMQEMFEIAEGGIKRITGTVELMSSYGKVGYARELIEYDVYNAAHEAAALVVPATGRRTRVDFDLQGDGIIECVPEEFNQLISNLIQNAVEACPQGEGVVRVSGSEDARTLTLSVKDNGPGVSETDAARIFTPFYTTKGPGRGMGMGLTIVWRVTQSLGGTVQVIPGPGAEFVLKLPRRQTGKLKAAS